MFKTLYYLPLISFFFFLIAIICCAKANYKPDPNLERVQQGKASKIVYQDHSYVVWSINLGGGIVHDPDCKCHFKGN